MHEYSIVENMIKQINDQLTEQGIEKVNSLRLRRSSTFSAGALQQAYEMLTPGTPLADAELIIEELHVEHICPNCQHKAFITADDLVGHNYICDQCGYSDYVDEAHGLELLSIETEP